MAKIPLHGILDKALGFSLRDLKLESPDDVEEFRKKLDEAIQRLEEEKQKEQKKNQER